MTDQQMTMREFHERLGRLGPNEIVLDVREPAEFKEVRIKGARNIPLAEVAKHANELRGYDRIYVHCRRGGRATKAYEALRAEGLTNLVCIGDWGIEAWLDAGFPVEN